MSDLKLAFILPVTGRFANVPIPVLFNPSEYTIEKGNTYQSTTLPGMATPVSQFVAGNADTLSMELFFDTYSPSLRKHFVPPRSDVRIFTRPIAELLEIDSTIHAPPVVRFVWGAPLGSPLGLHFKAIIERFSQRFTMFLDDGTPVRAIVNITFKEYKTVSDQLAELALESADRTTLRTIKEGDSLWYLAAENYGDSEQWRAIAEANDIENPRLLSAGRQIEIPPLE
jgi:hypothetical protein